MQPWYHRTSSVLRQSTDLNELPNIRCEVRSTELVRCSDRAPKHHLQRGTSRPTSPTQRLVSLATATATAQQPNPQQQQRRGQRHRDGRQAHAPTTTVECSAHQTDQQCTAKMVYLRRIRRPRTSNVMLRWSIFLRNPEFDPYGNVIMLTYAANPRH